MTGLTQKDKMRGKNERTSALYAWLKQQLGDIQSLVALAGDASFRRYFRVTTRKGQYVAVDASMSQKDNRPFVAIANAFIKLGLQVPKIQAINLTQGFLLLTDFGNDLLLQIVNQDNAQMLYTSALSELVTLQSCRQVVGWQLPQFDYELFMLELTQFKVWYLEQHLGLVLTTNEQRVLQQSFDFLIANAVEQPQVCVHRDYHSRNLMRLNNGRLGILDFQDTLWGPITYDLVSLLRDSYIDWPNSQVMRWVEQFYAFLPTCKNEISLDDFIQWFDIMGVQRHLKVLYIFSRLRLSYNNPNYIQYIPRALSYLLLIMPKYKQLASLQHFFENRVLPYESDVTCCRAWETLGRVNA